MSCDISCDHGYMPFHCPRKRKRIIKSRKIDKKKRKMVKSKYTTTTQGLKL